MPRAAKPGSRRTSATAPTASRQKPTQPAVLHSAGHRLSR